MRNQTSRLAALGTFVIGVLVTDQGQAFFDGTSRGWPNPQIQSPSSSGHYYLGQGSVWGGSAPNYTNGWSFARYQNNSGGADHCLSWNAQHSLNSSSDIVTVESGAACTLGGYKLVEHYWDGNNDDYGVSNISGNTGVSGGCDEFAFDVLEVEY